MTLILEESGPVVLQNDLDCSGLGHLPGSPFFGVCSVSGEIGWEA